jgi:hypothetical protein
MHANDEDRVVRLPQEAGQRMHHEGVPRPPSEPPTVDFATLPEARPDSQLYQEWNVYRRMIGRLLAECHEGKWLLIKSEEIIGMWDTQADANAVRLERFLTQPVLMKQILAQEPILRIGYNRLCRS